MKSLILVLNLFCCTAFGQILPVIKEKPVIDKNPVSNQEWLEFVKFIKNDAAFTQDYVQSMLPDNWTLTNLNTKANSQSVEGVNWHQAGEFCKWRSVVATYQYTHSGKASYSQMLNKNKIANKVLICRLPTENEFNEFAAKTSNTKKQDTGFRCVLETKRNI